VTGDRLRAKTNGELTGSPFSFTFAPLVFFVNPL